MTSSIGGPDDPSGSASAPYSGVAAAGPAWMDLAMVVLAAGAVLWALLQALSKVHGDVSVGVDDANITFVYARNIAAGHGYVYNVGGERVEGSTSLVWTHLCAAVYWLGGAEVEIRQVSIACFVLAQAIFGAVLAALAAGPPRSDAPRAAPSGLSGLTAAFLVYFALVLSCPGYLVWNCLTLMDAVLWGLCVSAAAWFIVRPPNGPASFAAAAGVWAVMGVVRPDAMLIGPAFAAIAGWNAAAKGVHRGLVVAGILGLAVAASIGGATLFRLAYFGYPLPNTYYAKISHSWYHNLVAGVRYDLSWLYSSPVIAAGVLFAGACAWEAFARIVARTIARKPGRAEGEDADANDALRPQQALSFAFGTLCAVPMATGGDHFYEHRFLLPAYPILCLLLADWARRTDLFARSAAFLKSAGAAAPWPIVAASVIAVPPFLHEHHWWSYRSFQPLNLDFGFAASGRRRGTEIGKLFAPREPSAGPDPVAANAPPRAPLPTLGVFAAGGTGFTYPGPKFDVFGLNSVAMGHSKSDRTRAKNHSAFHPDVFYETLPELLDIETPDDRMRANVYTLGMLESERFRSRYVYGRLRRTAPPKAAEPLYIRRDYLAKLLSGPENNGFGVPFVWEKLDETIPKP